MKIVRSFSRRSRHVALGDMSTSRHTGSYAAFKMLKKANRSVFWVRTTVNLRYMASFVERRANDF